MKIALISQPYDKFLPPAQNSIGIWIYEIARHLAKQNQVIVYGRGGSTAKPEIGDNVNVRYVFTIPNPWLTRLSSRFSRYVDPKKPIFSRSLFHQEYILPIALHLRRQAAGIAHIQNYSQFIPIIRAFNPEIKIALHMRCDWLALLDYDLVNSRLEKTDLILGVSDHITQDIRERFPHHAHKCFTAYTGVDIDTFKPPQTPNPQLENERRILFVGRVTPEKGVHILLEAFRIIAYRFPDLHLDLVGSISSLARDRLVGMSEDERVHQLDKYYSGIDYYTSLVDIIPADLRERVHFVRFVPYSKTLDYYQHADLVINPALVEPFGRSLIEANACGVPTIASRAGGMVELVEHGSNGLLVEPGNVNELAQAIQLLLENEPLRKQMGWAGREFVVERFSWDRVTADLLSIYANVLDEVEVNESQLAHHSVNPK